MIKMSDMESTDEASSPNGQHMEEAGELFRVPAPVATGNDKIIILKHGLAGIVMDRDQEYPIAKVELAIRNVSDFAIATAVFEAIFYDKEGKVVDTVRHSEVELDPATSRAIHIASSIPVYEYDDIVSYDVRLVRMTTVDFEKLQFRNYELGSSETGEEQIKGIVKNLSRVKSDAGVVATFYDAKKETLGTRILMLREIEPNSIRRFDLRFKPQEGETVASCSLSVGELVG